MENLISTLISQLDNYRKKYGVTFSDMSKKTNIKPSILARIFKNKMSVSLEQLTTIGKYFDLTLQFVEK